MRIVTFLLKCIYLFTLSDANQASIYRTEPSFRRELFDITHMTSNGSSFEPAYFFLDPSPHGMGWGPQIYDMNGDLVWQGPPTMNSQDFHVCEHLGKRGSHLCVHAHDIIPTKSKKMVWDAGYQTVFPEYTTGLSGTPANGHEFHVLPGGVTFLQAIQIERLVSLGSYIGRDGFVSDCCFQEIAVSNGSSVFNWCYLDHLPIWITSLFIDTGHNKNVTSAKAGKGIEQNPWDFCHLNSIDKTDEDYLISGRHIDQLIKIAGPNNRHGIPPGSVIWRLGGKQNDFNMDFSFSKQHHARFISVNSSTTILSLLNNAWEGTNEPSASTSAGQIILVNNVTMTASLIRSYKHPYGALTSDRGSMQLLPNGNVFIGWGRLPEFTEYEHNGTVLFHARFGKRFQTNSTNSEDELVEFSYRSYKFSWIGKPLWRPKVYAKRDHGHSEVTLWVSWNGATEVDRWRILWTHSRDNMVDQAGIFAKNGFETEIQIPMSANSELAKALPLITVEALDCNGKILASNTADIFLARRVAFGIILISLIEMLPILCRHHFGLGIGCEI